MQLTGESFDWIAGYADDVMVAVSKTEGKR
jgi:hypothetical protein